MLVGGASLEAKRFISLLNKFNLLFMLLHARNNNLSLQSKKLIFAFNTINAKRPGQLRVGNSSEIICLFEVSEKTINYLGLKIIVATIESIVQDKVLRRHSLCIWIMVIVLK